MTLDSEVRLQEITEPLKILVARILSSTPNFSDLHWAEKSMTMMRVLNVPDQEVLRLKAEIGKNPLFQSLESGWVQTGLSGRQMQEDNLLYLISMTAAEGGSVEPLLRDAAEFASSKQCAIEVYTPLAGIKIDGVLTLTGATCLVPWADVPDDAAKRDFDRVGWGKGRKLDSPTFSMLAANPNCALKSLLAPRVILYSSQEQGEVAAENHRAEFNGIRELHQDIIRCLTITTNSIVADLACWMHFDREIVNRIAGGGYTFSSATHETGVRHASIRPVEVDHSSLAAIVRAFIAAPLNLQQTMRVAVDRLNQSLRRTTLVDRFIDLGTALEVMLLHGIGTKDRGELKYRAAIRAAVFLGSTHEERIRIFKLVREAYDLRSTAVHAGIIDSKKSPDANYELLLRQLSYVLIWRDDSCKEANFLIGRSNTC